MTTQTTTSSDNRVGNSFEKYLETIPVVPEQPQLTPDQIAQEEHRREQQHRQSRFADLQKSRGARYRDCTFKNWIADSERRMEILTAVQSFAESIPDRLKAGGGLIMFGPAGTGKDHLLMATMRSAILDHGLSVEWHDGFDLFAKIKSNIATDSVDRFVRDLKAPDVLAISDPVIDGADLTEFELRCLRRIIEMRYSDYRSTWITTNVSDAAEGIQAFTAPVFGRLIDSATAIKFDLPNFRRPNGFTA